MTTWVLSTGLVMGIGFGISGEGADVMPGHAQLMADQPREGGTTSEVPGTKSHVVHGEVLNIEGSAYVIQQHNGQEVRLPVDQDTRMEHTPKVGDNITAQMAEDGRTRSIRKASAGVPPAERAGEESR